MGRRARVHRPEDFGRYDPINHALYIDREPHVAPGIPSQPITLKVGAKGRLNAVLESRDAEILSMAVEKGGVPMEEPLTRHDRRGHHGGLSCWSVLWVDQGPTTDQGPDRSGSVWPSL